MTLIVGDVRQWRSWDAVGVEFQLSPLSGPDKRAIEAACRVLERDPQDPKIILRAYVEPVAYAMAVGRKCIRDWRPIIGAKVAIQDAATGLPVPYSEVAAESLMTIPAVVDWIITRVEGLSLHVREELEDAGKG